MDTPICIKVFSRNPKVSSDVSQSGKFINDLLKVDHFHMQQFAYLIDKMDAIQESDGTTLLDNTIFTYGSGLGDGATHQYNGCPL